MKSNPLISIIIPTHNEQDHISDCLSTLSTQSYKPIEIIVVDDGSTDKTVNLVKKYKQVKLFKQSHLGPGTARNKGVSKSKGSILVFVDADMHFDRKFISKLTQPIRTGTSIGTFSNQEFVANTHNPWANSWSLVRGFEQGKMHPAKQSLTQPVFRAITRKTFLSSGGFDTTRGYDDDWSLSEKLGTKATSAPGAIFYHHNPSSLGEIFAQAKWMGTRKYKFGLVGKLFTLIRNFFLFSILRALYLSIKHKSFHVFATKICLDYGISLGITKSR